MPELLHLVIADDEAFMRENLSAIFPWKELGYTVDALFSNGKETLDYLSAHDVDVVLTDIRMPVMDGLSLICQIRRLRIPADVVFLSAYSDFEYAQKGVYYGAADYLVKPVAYQELTALFTRLRRRILDERRVSPETQALSKISGYIKAYPAQASLEACAASTGFTESFISELLRTHVSMNFTEYVYQEKMVLAGKLLHDIHLQIAAIAHMLGYTNAKNFSRAFHNYYHMTPMQYRKLGTD